LWWRGPIWLDGDHVLLPGHLLPLEGVSGSERRERTSNLYNIIVDASTRTITRAARLPRSVQLIKTAEWNEGTQILVEQATDINKIPGPELKWRRTSGQWVRTDGAAKAVVIRGEASPIEIRESLNDRPVLVDRATHTVVLDPNRSLDEFLGRVEEVMFDVNGRSWSGRLYYPPNFDPKRQYAVVLQTHGEPTNAFSLSGYSRHYAAQPLAARGIVVLQLDDYVNLQDVEGTPAIQVEALLGYEAAISYLEKRINIDRRRVLIVGWSRTGPLVTYALTHSEIHFAAAVLTDTGEESWANYFTKSAYASSVARIYGSRPFGEGIKYWLERAPTFNLDRIQSPILIWKSFKTSGLNMRRWTPARRWA
jgi:hypothetical protein